MRQLGPNGERARIHQAKRPGLVAPNAVGYGVAAVAAVAIHQATPRPREGTVTDLFADKAADWDADDRHLRRSQTIAEAIIAATPLSSTTRVMDFGAGTGLLTAQLAPHVGQVTAVDTSGAMLAQLSAKPELRDKVDVVCQDIVAQPLLARFDLVISAMSLHHVEDTAALLATFHEVLDPAGRLALADLDVEPGTFHPPEMDGIFHHGFERAALQRAIEAAGFAEVAFSTATTMTREGRDYPIFLVTAVRS